MTTDTLQGRAGPGFRNRLRDYLALTKFRLLTLVLISTAMGYYLSSLRPFDIPTFVHVMIGVLLVGGGANTLNQWYERRFDQRMHRTRNRPLPAGRLRPWQALVFGLLISLAGFGLLAVGVNRLTLILAFISWSSYLFLYTPLKRLSALNTWVGAIPGALPAVLGCTAASGELNLEAVTLFLVLFLWQMPHFFAISWIYREDYQRGGFHMLSADDPQGIATSTQILTHTLLLLIASISLFFLGDAGLIYLVSAIMAGLANFFFAINFYMVRTIPNARGVFRMSLLYLPILFAALIIDRLLS